jgi:hypothetical protein
MQFLVYLERTVGVQRFEVPSLKQTNNNKFLKKKYYIKCVCV